jgi:hypothetical protein
MGGRTVKYKAVIRDNSSGEERTYDPDEDWKEIHEWMWSMGNYSCDCSLSEFFLEAKGEISTEPPVCGSTRYKLARIEFENGGSVEPDDDGGLEGA